MNARVEECADPSYSHARLRYTHTRELDSFHTVPSDVPGEPALKVRVTRDQKDPSKVRAVQKVRVADMNIHSPKRLFDFRVSVSLEIPSTPKALDYQKVALSLTLPELARPPSQPRSRPPRSPARPPARATKIASRTPTNYAKST